MDGDGVRRARSQVIHFGISKSRCTGQIGRIFKHALLTLVDVVDLQHLQLHLITVNLVGEVVAPEISFGLVESVSHGHGEELRSEFTIDELVHLVENDGASEVVVDEALVAAKEELNGGTVEQFAFALAKHLLFELGIEQPSLLIA